MGCGGISASLQRFAGLLGLTAGCLVLANCSGNVAKVGKLDPRHGVASTARVVKHAHRIPKGGGVYRVGRPYTIAGRTYVPKEEPNYSKIGLASWYGADFHGRYTANGEVFDMNAISAASPTLPLPSYVRVTNLQNRRSLVVRVNDRGPYVGNRLIDVSVRAAKLLGFYGQGLAKVKVEYVGRAPLKGSSDGKLAQTLRKNLPASREKVASAQPLSFAKAYFDPHPMSGVVADRERVPQARPNTAGEAASPPRRDRRSYARPVRTPQHAARQTVELAAAARPSEPVPQAAPVSAYAPLRYDGHAGYLTGRGLY